MNDKQYTSSPEEILKAIPLFKNLSDDDLELIASRLHREHYPKGTIVFEEGDTGDSMYLVESGQVQVVGEGYQEAIAVMGPGNFVGDIALLLGQPRTAALEVTIDAQLWTLKREDFDDLIETRPSIALEMMRELSRRLVTATRRKRQAARRRITAIAGGGKGVELSQAIHTNIKSTVGLLLLSRDKALPAVTLDTGVMVLDSQDLTEASLAESLSHQIEVFKHIVLLLPDHSTPLVQKAIDLADTIVCIGDPPGWLSESKETSEMWVVNDTQVDLLRTARRLTNRTVGLALSSGGTRGLAHIGVIKVLVEENIPIDMIAGTSAGALFGALHAVGWSYEQILAYIQDLKSLTEFRNWDFTPPRLSGIVRGRKARNEFLARPLGDRTFEDLETPLYIVAADILTGEEVVFGSGPLAKATLADAIRASVSIPVLPDPWHYVGRYLVDGGLVNPLPASVLCDHGADIVIASSVIRPLRDSYAGSRDKMPHVLQTVSNIFTAMEAEIVKEQLPLIDILIPHNVSAKHTFDFEHAEELIRSGEEAARQMIPDIKEKLEKPDEEE